MSCLEMCLVLERMVSGGQTGADRAAIALLSLLRGTAKEHAVGEFLERGNDFGIANCAHEP